MTNFVDILSHLIVLLFQSYIQTWWLAWVSRQVLSFTGASLKNILINQWSVHTHVRPFAGKLPSPMSIRIKVITSETESWLRKMHSLPFYTPRNSHISRQPAQKWSVLVRGGETSSYALRRCLNFDFQPSQLVLYYCETSWWHCRLWHFIVSKLEPIITKPAINRRLSSTIVPVSPITE